MFTRTLPFAAAVLVFAAAAHAQPAHPHVLFGAEQIASLRAQAQGSQKALASSLIGATTGYRGSSVSSSGTVSFAGGSTLALGDLRDIGNSLITFAFAYELDGSDAAYQLAHDWLMRVAGWGDFDLDGTHDLIQAQLLIGTSLGYDMLAPRLSATERQTVVAAIARNADALMAAGKSGIWWEGELLQNHNWINHAAVGFAALATDGETDAARNAAWLGYATTNARAVQAALNGNVDGTWHEGFGYASYGLSFHLPFLDALVRAGGPDLRDLAFLRGIGRTRAAVQLPETPNRYVLTSGDFFGFSSDEALLPLRYAASHERDGVAQAVADRWIAGTHRSTYAPELAQEVFEFLATDPSVPAADLHTLPLDHLATDLQAAIFRSGWDEGATLFALKDGPFTGTASWNRYVQGLPPQALNFGHDHADDNGFYLYGHGSWLAPEAAGYYIGHAPMPGQEANRTVFHNSLLIDGAGQLGEGVHTAGDEAGGYAWFKERTGALAGFTSTAHFGYVRGDGARLYPSSTGLTRWDRHALFVDRQWVILRDVIQATQPHTYGWLCHFLNGVQREGGWLHGEGANGQSLGVALVAPAQVNVAIATQAPVNVQKLSPSGSVYQATVTPAASATDTTFLTALVPTAESDWASRPVVTALDPAHPDVGLTATQDGLTTVALFSDVPGGSASAAAYALVGTTGVIEARAGAPTRALLVEGTRLVDPSRALITLEAAGTLEADGIDGDLVTISGTASAGTIYAPHATRVVRDGQDVAFTREGDAIHFEAAAPTTDGGTPPPTDGGPATPDGGSGANDGTSPLQPSTLLGKVGTGCSMAGRGSPWALIPLLALAFLLSTRRRSG